MKYMLVDGYNVIHANQNLSDTASQSLDHARVRLCDALCEFSALSAYSVIVVFDAHLVAGGIGSHCEYRNIVVVYTAHAQTADEYIEKTAHRISRTSRASITVATNDTLEQLIIMGRGGNRISAQALWQQVEQTREKMRQQHIRPGIKKNPLLGQLDEKTTDFFNKMLGI